MRLDSLIQDVTQLGSQNRRSRDLSRIARHKQCSASQDLSSISLAHRSAVSDLNQSLHTPVRNSHLRATHPAALLEQSTNSHHHTSHQSSHRNYHNTIPRANAHRPRQHSTNCQVAQGSRSQLERVATQRIQGQKPLSLSGLTPLHSPATEDIESLFVAPFPALSTVTTERLDPPSTFAFSAVTIAYAFLLPFLLPFLALAFSFSFPLP